MLCLGLELPRLCATFSTTQVREDPTGWKADVNRIAEKHYHTQEQMHVMYRDIASRRRNLLDAVFALCRRS